ALKLLLGNGCFINFPQIAFVTDSLHLILNLRLDSSEGHYPYGFLSTHDPNLGVRACECTCVCVCVCVCVCECVWCECMCVCDSERVYVCECECVCVSVCVSVSVSVCVSV